MARFYLLSICFLVGLLVGPADGQFIRSDANGDGNFNLDDSVYLASYLYTEGPAPVNDINSGDSNDNGAVELSDIVYLLRFAFLGGDIPPPPFPTGGPDPTPNDFDPPTDPDITFDLPSITVFPGDLGIEMPLILSSDENLNGVEVALTFDPSSLIVNSWDFTDTILGFSNAEYITQEISNDPADPFAWMVAIVDFATPIDGHFIPAGAGLTLARITVSVPLTAPAPQDTAIEYAAEVSAPPKRNLVVVDAQVVRPTTSGGQVQIRVPFIRGDANFDSMLDVSDVIFSTSWLFLSGPAHPCEDSADTNNDGALDLADPVYLLNYLFQMGPSPSEPFPVPGADPDLDLLGCDGPFP